MPEAGRRLFLVLAITVLVADQVTKAAATAWLLPAGSTTIIPGLFDLSYTLNTGAVFGVFREMADPWRSLLLTIVPLIAVLIVIVMAWRTEPRLLRPHAALGLIFGGAIGNMVDRLRLGAVVDFLEFYIGAYHWPNFNIADSAICVGVGLLILDMWRTSTES